MINDLLHKNIQMEASEAIRLSKDFISDKRNLNLNTCQVIEK